MDVSANLCFRSLFSLSLSRKAFLLFRFIFKLLIVHKRNCWHYNVCFILEPIHINSGSTVFDSSSSKFAYVASLFVLFRSAHKFGEICCTDCGAGLCCQTQVSHVCDLCRRCSFPWCVPQKHNNEIHLNSFLIQRNLNLEVAYPSSTLLIGVALDYVYDPSDLRDLFNGGDQISASGKASELASTSDGIRNRFRLLFAHPQASQFVYSMLLSAQQIIAFE